MTGKNWNSYFKGLPVPIRQELFNALLTLDNDRMFQASFGSDFFALAALIAQPLEQKPDPIFQDTWQRYLKAKYQ